MALRRQEAMVRRVDVLTVVSNWRQSPTTIPWMDRVRLASAFWARLKVLEGMEWHGRQPVGFRVRNGYRDRGPRRSCGRLVRSLRTGRSNFTLRSLRTGRASALGRFAYDHRRSTLRS